MLVFFSTGSPGRLSLTRRTHLRETVAEHGMRSNVLSPAAISLLTASGLIPGA